MSVRFQTDNRYPFGFQTDNCLSLKWILVDPLESIIRISLVCFVSNISWNTCYILLYLLQHFPPFLTFPSIISEKTKHNNRANLSVA